MSAAPTSTPRRPAVAFTGTSVGMTMAQQLQVASLLRELRPAVLIHGDCVGADDQAHAIALQNGVYTFTIRPGCDAYGESPKRACASQYRGGNCTVYAPEPYLIRNEKIVVDGDVLLATPSGEVEQRRSGTWSTIRVARRRKKQIILVLPDGRVKRERSQA